MDDAQLQRDLRLMNLQPGARITNQIAHDVCVREGAAATIDGAIASLGKSYVITLQAITCQDGATLAREQIQAEDKEHVLNALGSAATTMRGKLGESLNFDPEAESSAGTGHHCFARSTSELHRRSFRDGPGPFSGRRSRCLSAPSQSIQNFAMAYYLLGIAVEQAGDMARSAEYAKQAFLLIDRVSEYERTGITAYYYRATGELDKEIDAYQLGVRNYPRDWGFHNQLSLIYIDEGQI